MKINVMRLIFVLFVCIHALIHVLGFLKGFEIKDFKELTLPISRTEAVFWLVASVLFIIYTFLVITNNRYSWVAGFFAVILSQILVLLFWKDAKFGTIPNLIILVGSIISFSAFSFENMVAKEARGILNQNRVYKERIVTEYDIARLPDPVQRWLRNSGVVGKPFLFAGEVVQTAEMKMKPDQKNWMRARALQYTTLEKPAFIWSVKVYVNNFLDFTGRDKLEEGKAEMLIKLISLITVVNEKGEKLDEGAIQRYLGEMVWFPTLALSPFIQWEEVDENSAKATMSYKGKSGSGTFYFNSRGDFIKFSAMRYKDNVSNAKKFEWVLLVDEYKTFDGVRVPSKMTATWKLKEGDWTWLRLKIDNLKYNEDVRIEKMLSFMSR